MESQERNGLEKFCHINSIKLTEDKDFYLLLYSI